MAQASPALRGSRPLPLRTRAALLALLLAWHALLLYGFFRPQPPRQSSPDVAMTWLWLDEPPAAAPTPPADETAPAVSRRPAAAPTQAMEPAAEPQPSTAIALAPAESQAESAGRIDWYAFVGEAARAQVPEPLPQQRPPEPMERRLELPPPEVHHKRGEEEYRGDGVWRTWLGSRCFTETGQMKMPLPPGQIEPMKIRCLRSAPTIDVDALEKRRPGYITPPQPRAGPARGGELLESTVEEPR